MTKLTALLSQLAIVIILFASCTPERKEDKKDIPVNSLEEVLKNLSPQVQTFEINPTVETNLKGEKGTAIYIPANAFRFADGTTPKGKVNIALKECYTLTDMISENLNTTSAYRILETGGMIYFNASANGKQLVVSDGKAFVVGFPKDGQTKEMDLFYDVAMSDSTSTWIPDYEMFDDEAMQVANSEELSSEGEAAENVNYTIELTDDLYDYGYFNSLTTATFYDLKLKGQNRTIIDYIDDPLNADRIGAQEFSINEWRVHFVFNIDENGVMNNFRVEDDEYTKYNDRAVQIALNLLNSAPAFDLANYDHEVKHDWDFELGIMGGRSINKDRLKAKFRLQFAEYKEKAIQQLDKTALDYYMFSATKMGWINCDRFWEIDEEEKTDFIVTTQAANATQIQIIFKDINSIMTGTQKDGQLVFENVPLGRQIKVIGISYSNGKPTMAVAETTIDQDGFVLLSAFNAFSLDDLENELNK